MKSFIVIIVLFFSVVVFSQETNEVEVPYFRIDEAPNFPVCEGNNDEHKKCFKEIIEEHIISHFDSKKINELGYKAGMNFRFHGLFTITKYGDIEEVMVKTLYPSVGTEIIRIINLLPKLEPGKHKGKKVKTKYNFPMMLFVDSNNVLQKK